MTTPGEPSIAYQQRQHLGERKLLNDYKEVEVVTLPLLGLGHRELTSTLQPAAHLGSKVAEEDLVIQEAADTCRDRTGLWVSKALFPLYPSSISFLSMFYCQKEEFLKLVHSVLVQSWAPSEITGRVSENAVSAAHRQHPYLLMMSATATRAIKVIPGF